MVRHRTLTPAYAGSNPATPANYGGNHGRYNKVCSIFILAIETGQIIYAILTLLNAIIGYWYTRFSSKRQKVRI